MIVIARLGGENMTERQRARLESEELNISYCIGALFACLTVGLDFMS